MTKAIVETIGPFQLTGSMFDLSDAVPFDRPAVVVRTSFIDVKIGADVDGRLKLYGNVDDEATDADWLEHITECGYGTDDFDPQFAYESYPFAQVDEARGETASQKKAREKAEAVKTKADRDAAEAADRAKAREKAEAEAEAEKQKPNDTSGAAPKAGANADPVKPGGELQKG